MQKTITILVCALLLSADTCVAPSFGWGENSNQIIDLSQKCSDLEFALCGQLQKAEMRQCEKSLEKLKRKLVDLKIQHLVEVQSLGVVFTPEDLQEGQALLQQQNDYRLIDLWGDPEDEE